jgi:hypothetical protein
MYIHSLDNFFVDAKGTYKIIIITKFSCHIVLEKEQK